MEIIHVVNIRGSMVPQKYFKMNLFQHEHLAITIVHRLLISRMNISLYIAPII